MGWSRHREREDAKHFSTTTDAERGAGKMQCKPEGLTNEAEQATPYILRALLSEIETGHDEPRFEDNRLIPFVLYLKWLYLFSLLKHSQTTALSCNLLSSCRDMQLNEFLSGRSLIKAVWSSVLDEADLFSVFSEWLSAQQEVVLSDETEITAGDAASAWVLSVLAGVRFELVRHYINN